MPEQGTITARMGLDNKPLVDGLKDSQKLASDFSQKLKSSFNKDSFESMARGLKSGKDATEGFGGAVGGLAGNLKVAGASGLALSALTTILIRSAQAGKQSRDEVLGLERETHKLVRTADFSTASEGVDELTVKYRGLSREARRVRDAQAGFSETRHPLLAEFRHLGEQIRGRESLFGGPSESENKIAKAQAEIQERRAKIAAEIASSAKIELEVTQTSIEQSEIEGRIKQEQLQTETRIAQLRRKGFGPEVIGPIQKESDLRIRSLKAQESFAKLDIASEFQRAQLERPGIGLTQPQVQGAELFRQREDIQQKLRIEPSAAERSRLGIQADVNRNQIEDAEFQQLFRRGAKSGRGNSGGGMFHTADEGLRAFAKYRERIQDTIRNDPALRNQLDVEIGKPFAFQAPRQTQLMPSTQGPTGASDTQHDISGGRSLNDIYTLIDKKWQ